MTHAARERIMMRCCALALALLGVQATFAAPRTDDYAQGMRVDADSNRPLAQLQLPDEVYQYATRTDLGDVRIFNADGVAVPHAFCASATTQAATVSRRELPVFDLQAAIRAGSSATRVEVDTAGGTQVHIQEGDASPAAHGTQTWAHVIDARGVAEPLRSIEFDWSSPDGASQAQVRIDTSDDLDRWRTVVSSTTLLRVADENRELQRKVVELPPQRYEYLRVVRTDGGPALALAGVIGESQTTSSIEPVWFDADPLREANGNERQFDARRIAPIAYARVRLPQDNASVQVRIESRPDAQAPWRERWRGETYTFMKDGQRRTSAAAQIATDHDRYWRIVPLRTQDTVAGLDLELGYRPATLRFLVQGDGPFTLAFGSRRADPAPRTACDSLLSGLAERDLRELIGNAVPGSVQALGGEVALKPLPRRTPLRLVVLWGVLIMGAAVVVAMAVALLRRLNAPPT